MSFPLLPLPAGDNQDGRDARNSLPDPPPAAPEDWAASDVRRLRGHLGDTQAQFADRLGTRQQTVSEWETGSSRPRRMARRLLHLVAEERGFYTLGAAAPGGPARDALAPEAPALSEPGTGAPDPDGAPAAASG